MNGELAQLIALAAHGSPWLAGRAGEAAPDLEGNSTFQHVRNVRFELEGGLLRSSTVFENVADWLLAARRRGVNRLWLVDPRERTVEDRKLAAFIGTVPWILLATSKDQHAEVWRGAWTVGDPDAADHQTWDVAYSGRRASDVVVPHQDAAAASERLKVALREAQDFAGSHDIDEWAAVFGAALQLGDAPDPVPPFHPDMFPPTAFGRPARRLLAMATRADEFGGSGSWNDLGFAPGADAEAFERISTELSAAMSEAFVAAVDGSTER